jgi:hypothetical protein
MHRAFPGSDYYGGSVPLRYCRQTTCLPAPEPNGPNGGTHPSGSHVHPGIDRQGRCPAMPLRPSTSTPQTFLVATQTGAIIRPRSPGGGHLRPRVTPRPSPHPPDSSWCVRLRGFMTLVPHVHLSVLLAGPEPSGSTSPSRRCQGCLPPSPLSPGSGCPQLQPNRCDDQAMQVSHLHSIPQRLVAHDVRDPQQIRRGRPQLQVGEFAAPAGGPTVACMWRDPR